MSFMVVGTNHKYCPRDLREKLFFAKGKLEEAFHLLRRKTGLTGAVILSTCNRTEIYADVGDVQTGTSEVIDFVAGYKKIDHKTFYPYFYIYEEKEALRHLCEVFSGVDSLITGELQIMEQVKTAFQEAENAEFITPCLRDMFHYAISIAGETHAKTHISKGKVSVGSVAVEFIKKKTGNLADKNMLVIGVGKVTELVLKYLKDEEVSVVFVANRTYDKAKELAGKIGAKAVRFDNLREFLEKADVIITATASPHFIIKKEMLEERSKRLLIIDLALPRDVDPKVRESVNIDLFTLGDLDYVIKENMYRKAKEAVKARSIINTEVEKLWEEFIKLEQEPVLSL
ncbi:MAG: glutamyl-tRNA reductase [Candidatus Omnitrophota bacterium]